MNRKTKLFFSLVSLCFSIAVLCFGVYSAMSVSYTVSGNVSYTIQDVFVSWTTRVYRMTSTTPLGTTSTVAEENQANVSAIQALGTGDNVPSDNYEQLTGEGYTDSDKTYDIENGTVTKPGEAYTPSFEVPSLTYGAPTNENQQGYAFYIVIDITNYGSEIVNAKVSMNNESTTLTNTDYRYTNGINIPATTDGTYGTGRLVIGLALSDVTVSESGNFGFTISINRGPATFGGYDNVLFDSATTAVVESVNVDGASTTYDTPVTFANAEAISLNSETIGAKEEKTVKITLKAQDSSSAYQRLRLTYSNLPEGLRVNSTSIFLPEDGTEKVFTIKFYNQTSEEISLENVQATISLENVSNLLMRDTINDYYYVEMGTIMRDTENEYIRWRYIADENRTSASGTPSDLSQLNGTYLLETDLVTEYLSDAYTILMQVMGATGEEQTALIEQLDNYLANNYTGTLCAYQSIGQCTGASGNYTGTNTEYSTDSNDYKTSTIRRYMNYSGDNTVYKHADFTEMGPTVFGSDDFNATSNGNQAGGKSNMVTDLNIDIEQDVIYNEIFARSLTNDLYADIGASNINTTTGTPIEVPSVNVEGLSNTNSDKFWLLSVAEANTLFPSGSAGDSYRDWNGTDQPMDEEGNLLMDFYWLRSPYSSYTDFAYFVYVDGSFLDTFVIFFCAARPAFQIS